MPTSTPQVDFDSAKEISRQLHDTLAALLAEFGAPAFLREIVSQSLAGLVFVVALVGLVSLQFVVAIGAWFGEAILDAIDTARQSNKEQVNELLASTVNEMLGTQFSGSEFAAGSQSGNSIEANKGLGDSLLQYFEEGFQATAPVSPDQGAENARKFAGFGVNFATSQAFFSILTEAASLGFLKEFHELPAGLMQALGLGRLQRLALQPLIRNSIQQPYDLYLKRQMRPDRLADAQYIRAMARGDFDEPYVRERLAEKGFPDDEIDALIHEFTTKLSVGDLATLMRYGQMTEDEATQQLVDQGVEKSIAQQMLAAHLAALADPRVTAYVNRLQQARIDGWIDQEQFAMLLDRVPWTEEAKQWELNTIGIVAENPRRRISFAQLKEGIVNGHVDFTYVDEWLKAEGYSDTDGLILTMEIIDAIKSAEAKTKAKAHTHAKLSAKGKTPPATLTP